MSNKNPSQKADDIIHVLFVGDDSYFADITKTILERLGYIISSAYNSSEAIDLMIQYHDVFDVMITDYSTPGMNGVELAKLATRVLVDTPIILYTGRFDLIDEQQISDICIAEIVKKPCNIRDLDVIIKKILDVKEDVLNDHDRTNA
jgi:DNA-binding NtrC family response regulator